MQQLLNLFGWKYTGELKAAQGKTDFYNKPTTCCSPPPNLQSATLLPTKLATQSPITRSRALMPAVLLGTQRHDLILELNQGSMCFNMQWGFMCLLFDFKIILSTQKHGCNLESKSRNEVRQQQTQSGKPDIWQSASVPGLKQQLFSAILNCILGFSATRMTDSEWTETKLH